MPRALRLQDAGYIHHVISIGNNRQPIFNSPKDFQRYLDLLEEARSLYPLKVYNYILMDNHVHLLVEPTEEGSLSKAMEHVSKGYAKYFNKTYNRQGHVFQGRFKSFLIQTDKYFVACSRYIDLNPVKANIVKDPKQYVWSAYKTLSSGESCGIRLDFHDLYNDLGSNKLERQISYKALVQGYQGEDLNLLDRKAGVLGDKEFRSSIKIR